jgi:hypothetical protein
MSQDFLINWFGSAELTTQNNKQTIPGLKRNRCNEKKDWEYAIL